MGKLQNFLSNFKKPAAGPAKTQAAPQQPSKKREPFFNFDNIYFVAKKLKTKTGATVISTTPYALSGEWKITNLSTGVTKNHAPETLFGMYECDKPTIDGEVKRILGGKNKDAVYTSSEAIVEIMCLGSQLGQDYDPYKILAKNPRFLALSEPAKQAEVAKHTAKTRLPLSAISTQCHNLGFLLNKDELDRNLRDSKQQLDAINKIIASRPKKPKDPLLTSDPMPMLKTPPIRVKAPINANGKGPSENGIPAR